MTIKCLQPITYQDHEVLNNLLGYCIQYGIALSTNVDNTGHYILSIEDNGGEAYQQLEKHVQMVHSTT